MNKEGLDPARGQENLRKTSVLPQGSCGFHVVPVKHQQVFFVDLEEMVLK